jgi:DNA end-binding protein Ku
MNGMRSIWSGTIGIGTLVLPVKLGTVTGDESAELHQVRKSDGSRISYRRFAAADGAEVPYSEIAKGYELPDGRTVVLTDEDFAKAYGEKSRNAKILQFVAEDALPRTAAGTSYYVQPGAGGEKAYALLARTMSDTGTAAVVSVAIRQRESLALLYANGDGYLILERLNWAADVKRPDFAAPDVNLSEAELDLAENLVTQMSGPFDWSSFRDESTEKLEKIVRAKAHLGQAVGTPATRPEGSPTASQDLEAALRASVAQFKTEPKTARKPRTRKAAA